MTKEKHQNESGERPDCHPENGTSKFIKVESSQKRLWIGVPWDLVYRAFMVLAMGWLAIGRPGVTQTSNATETHAEIAAIKTRMVELEDAIKILPALKESVDQLDKDVLVLQTRFEDQRKK
jgi:hypothetical protein